MPPARACSCVTVIDTPAGAAATAPLSQRIGLFRFDPLGFVQFAFPWGKPGTALAGESGPEPWQRAILERLGRDLEQRSRSPDEAVRLAVASGHGIGKSALVAWVILWALSTLSGTRGIVTANTEGQLRTKTWPELAKWHALAVNRHWFTYTATSLFYSAKPGHDRTWRVDAITWSENNTEAIAGLHNKGKRAFALFDEASSIADGVWETIEGALTDAGTQLFWLCFGNPTRTTGRFRECFAGGRFAHRWGPQQIDSRSVAMTSKAQIATWVADYGEESDFVRVRVKGEFPRAGTMQFIDSERVEQAVARELLRDPVAALVMGVDIARQGDDQTVIRFRRGLDARSIAAVKFRIPDLMAVAGRVMELVNSHHPDAVFVDGTGIGWGVVDRLAQLGCATCAASISGRLPTAPAAARPPCATPTSAPRCGATSRNGAGSGACPTTGRCAPTSPPSTTATTRPTPSGSSARTTCAAAAWPRPTTAMRWRSPSPTRSSGGTGSRNGASRKSSPSSSAASSELVAGSAPSTLNPPWRPAAAPWAWAWCRPRPVRS